MDDKERLHSVLIKNKHMVLSTANNAGEPWVTPLAYFFDNQFNIYWLSSKDSTHSTNIKQRIEVAIVIFMTEPKSDAIYIKAKAKELIEIQEIETAFNILKNIKQPEKFTVNNIRDVVDKSPWRLYKASPSAFYVRESSSVEGLYVTVRRMLEINV